MSKRKLTLSRSQAFEKILFGKIKETAPKGLWGSYVHRYRNKTIKESTVIELLRKNGWEKVKEEMWQEMK